MSVDLAGFLGVAVLAYLVPGPDFLVVVRAAAQRTSLGRAAAIGAQSGLCVHMAAAALGLSLLAARSAVAFTAIKLAGAAYLVYLGVRALIAARREAAAKRLEQSSSDGAAPAGGRAPTLRRERPAPTLRREKGAAAFGRPRRPAADGTPPADPEEGAPGQGPRAAPSLRAGFLQGFLTNVLNPKAALFFLSVLPQFIDRRHGSTTAQIFFLGALDVVIGVVYWMGLVVVAARLRGLLGRPVFKRRWDKATGWLFIAIGVGVASTG